MPNELSATIQAFDGQIRDAEECSSMRLGRGVETCTGRRRPTWPSCPSEATLPRGRERQPTAKANSFVPAARGLCSTRPGSTPLPKGQAGRRVEGSLPRVRYWCRRSTVRCPEEGRLPNHSCANNEWDRFRYTWLWVMVVTMSSSASVAS